VRYSFSTISIAVPHNPPLKGGGVVRYYMRIAQVLHEVRVRYCMRYGR
jgi:hypothetical protein